MTGPTTLKELMQAGDLTVGEVRRLASLVFDGITILDQNVVPYKITMPLFETFAGHIQQFIIKAVLDAGTVNILDAVDPNHSNADSVLADGDPEEGSMYGIVRGDLDPFVSEKEDDFGK